MARKLIHLNPDEAGRLRCNAAGCHFVEPSPMPFTPELIGRPCLKRGANLLTARDYADTRRLFQVIDVVNRLFGWLGTEAPTTSHHSVQVRTHAGEVTTFWRKPEHAPE